MKQSVDCFLNLSEIHLHCSMEQIVILNFCALLAIWEEEWFYLWKLLDLKVLANGYAKFLLTAIVFTLYSKVFAASFI